jgi:hypothetical protein
MLLLGMMLYSSDLWYIQLPIIVLASAGILVRELLKNQWYWFLVTLWFMGGLAFAWFSEGNQNYLMATACLAFLVSSSVPAYRNALLAHSTRLVIGLVFLFAVGWKLYTPDFKTGEFYTYMFLTDYRMAPAILPFSSLDINDIRENLEDISKSTRQQSEIVTLKSDPRIPFIAKGLAWLTLVLEALIALAFLFPRSLSLTAMKVPVRDCLLALFMLGSYVVAPVAAFGVVLCALGMAQAGNWSSRAVYLALFLVVQVLGMRVSLVVL